MPSAHVLHECGRARRNQRITLCFDSLLCCRYLEGSRLAVDRCPCKGDEKVEVEKWFGGSERESLESASCAQEFGTPQVTGMCRWAPSQKPGKSQEEKKLIV